jgi:hypothetical protein
MGGNNLGGGAMLKLSMKKRGQNGTFDVDIIHDSSFAMYEGGIVINLVIMLVGSYFFFPPNQWGKVLLIFFLFLHHNKKKLKKIKQLLSISM